MDFGGDFLQAFPEGRHQIQSRIEFAFLADKDFLSGDFGSDRGFDFFPVLIPVFFDLEGFGESVQERDGKLEFLFFQMHLSLGIGIGKQFFMEVERVEVHLSFFDADGDQSFFGPEHRFRYPAFLFLFHRSFQKLKSPFRPFFRNHVISAVVIEGVDVVKFHELFDYDGFVFFLT